MAWYKTWWAGISMRIYTILILLIISPIVYISLSKSSDHELTRELKNYVDVPSNYNFYEDHEEIEDFPTPTVITYIWQRGN